MKHKYTDLTLPEIIKLHKQEMKELKAELIQQQRLNRINKALFNKVLKDSVPVQTLRDHYSKQWQ